MDFKSTIDLIIRDLNEASEIIDDLKKYPGVPLLQVELAKAKCRSAGEVIALLKTISLAEPVASHSAGGKELSDLQDDPVSTTKPRESNPPSGEKKKESKAPEILSSSAENKPEAKVQLKKPTDTPIIADKFAPTADLYEEQLSSLKSEKDISDRLKAKTLTSLSEAIGISDKFLFIGEIFDGDREAYSQTISRLDNAAGIDEAKDIIMNFAANKTESEAVSQLLELVKLKLSSNE